MKRTFLFVVLTLLSVCVAFAETLYDNTTTDTLNTLLYSVGPYTAIGDQIHLAAQGSADSALVQLFNLGGAGTFDAVLQFYAVGTPVGSQLGGPFPLVGVSSAGLDIIDLTFALGSLAVPQDLIFVVGVNNASSGMDFGLNLFQPPTVGSSDDNFLMVQDGGFSKAVSDNENVYFQLSGTIVPEPSTLVLAGVGLVAAAIWRSILIYLKHKRLT